MKLEGKVAVVTGGASGLGEATVRRFAQEGCKVVVADLQVELGKAVVQSLGEDRALFVETNVTDEASVQNLIAKAVEKFGGVHIVVNSAGIVHAGTILSKKTTSKDFARVLSINVVGTFNVCKAAAQVMVKQDALNDKGEKGVLINVASIAGIEGQTGQTIYGGTKGAIIAMTLPLARDLGKHGVRVAAIAPGVFATPMGDKLDKRFFEGFEKGSALGRLGNSVEFADMCVGVSTNTYLTGSVIRLDGGLRLGHL